MGLRKFSEELCRCQTVCNSNPDNRQMEQSNSQCWRKGEFFWRDKPVFEGGLSKRSQTRWRPRPIHLSSSEPVCFCLPSPTERRVVESELSERNPAFQDPANSRRSQNNTKPNQRVPGIFCEFGNYWASALKRRVLFQIWRERPWHRWWAVNRGWQNCVELMLHFSKEGSWPFALCSLDS